MNTHAKITLLQMMAIASDRHILNIAYQDLKPDSKDRKIDKFLIEGTDSQNKVHSYAVDNGNNRNTLRKDATAGNLILEMDQELDPALEYTFKAMDAQNKVIMEGPLSAGTVWQGNNAAYMQHKQAKPFLVTLDNTPQAAAKEDTNVLWKKITDSTIVFNEHLSKYLDAVYINKEQLADQFNLQLYANSGTQDYQLLKIAVKKYIETRMFNDHVGGYFKGGTQSPMLQKSSIGAETINASLKTNDESIDILEEVLRNNTQMTYTKDISRSYKNYQFIELIYCYWMIVGGLERGMNMVASRFINSGNGSLLSRFDINTLNSVSTLLYGFIQDKKLSIDNQVKQNEIMHAYGLTLNPNGASSRYHPDSRIKFISSFHALLNKCSIIIKENDDLTRKPDAFKIYIHLKELNFILLDGFHNAYQEVNVNLRVEHIMQQYLLSRSEMREFLGGKQMLPYTARYIDRVDTLRNVQGQDSCFQHFDNLAELGEILLLSIRYGNWNDNSITEVNAMQWLEYFRTHIQKYMHSYRVVTGIDLSDDNANSMVSVDPRLLEAQPITLLNSGRRPQPTFRRY